MKKSVLVILIIILVILCIPRYNKCGGRSKTIQGQRFRTRKGIKDTDQINFLFPGKWLLNMFSYKSIRQYKTTCNSFISAGFNHTNYQPAMMTQRQYELV